jgi:FkbM family methyltransferase
MKSYLSNQDRTSEYLEKFDREKTLKYLIKEKSPLIVDVGANLGSTLEEFKQWWPESTLHCFEPQKECWDSLSERAAQYHDDDVKIIKKAAGNKSNQELILYSHDISSGISGFNRVNLESNDSIQLHNLESSDQSGLEQYSNQFNHERVVSTIRLDDYLQKADVKYVDLLKIDTQGFEPEVLEGAGKLLQNVGVVLTELMFYDYYERSLSFSDIEKYLLPAGFTLYDINHISKNPMNGRTDWVDLIYVNRKVLKEAS